MASEPVKTSFLGTIALALVAIAALFVGDTFLANTEQSETRADASRWFRQGQQFMREGRSADAVRQFQTAVATSRGNRDYQLALAQALLGAGRLEDAQNNLSDLLQHDPTEAGANLVMARVFLRNAKVPEATAYFHRAIYGRWKDDPTGNRVKARFELVDVLVRENLKEELLAELLPLEEDAPHDTETRKRIGALFLAAGSPPRAAEIFRDILRHDPEDPDARAGLGAAEFARGNYRAAQGDYLAAARLNPEDASIRNHLEECSQILELDPTLRGLPSSERYRRSVKLVELTLDDVSLCASSNDLIDEAKKTLKRPVSAAHQTEAVDANLDLAEQLWQLRKKDCKPTQAQTEEPIALILAKLAQ